LSNELAISDEHLRALEIFHPYALGKMLEATRRNQRFVYYTSADTAMRILRNGEIWMRKSHLMNDYREIEHGFDCLNDAYKKSKQRMLVLFDGMFPGFCDRLETAFNNWLPHFRTDSYITCLSEHDPSEDQYGRLSMWRAYGGGAGVALVVNGGPFLRPSNALRAYASPVAYFHNAQVEEAFTQILSNVENNGDFVRSLGEQQLQGNMFAVLRYAILCTKHPGFHEEREWRVIYSPRFERSERITSSIESVNEIPQSICRIPLKDVPEEGLYGLAPSEFVERVIIGPSKFPAGIYDAFMVLLAEVGIPKTAEKIILSDVPLRN
jgi:Protein of unknown function (DUF2971)